MTVAETTTPIRNDYLGNGVVVNFNFTFQVLPISNSVISKNYSIKVLLTVNDIETEQVEDVDYSVTYNSSTRLGLVTFFTAPLSNQIITLLSDIPRSQDTDYISLGTGKFPARSHEGTVDKLTLIIREQEEKINRAILLPNSSELTNINIPVSPANANKAIVVNPTGDNLSAKSLLDIDTFPITAFAETLLDDETATEARDTLDAQQLNANLTFLSGRDLFASNINSGLSLLPSQIIISNGTDTGHDIDFTAGNFGFYDGSGQGAMTAKTGEIDAAFGTGNGMLDAGTVTLDETYHLFTVYNPTTGDSKPLASLSPTAPTMTLPNADGYTVLGEWLSAILTNSSSNIINGTYYSENRGFIIKGTPIEDFDGDSTTTATSRPLSVPTGVKVIAKISAQCPAASTNTTYIYSPNSDDPASISGTYNATVANLNDDANRVPLDILTNTSGQIRTKSSGSHAIAIYTIGWFIPKP